MSLVCWCRFVWYAPSPMQPLRTQCPPSHPTTHPNQPANPSQAVSKPTSQPSHSTTHPTNQPISQPKPSSQQANQPARPTNHPINQPAIPAIAAIHRRAGPATHLASHLSKSPPPTATRLVNFLANNNDNVKEAGTSSHCQETPSDLQEANPQASPPTSINLSGCLLPLLLRGLLPMPGPGGLLPLHAGGLLPFQEAYHPREARKYLSCDNCLFNL